MALVGVTPENMHIRAVAVQSTVSMNTDSICTKPC